MTPATPLGTYRPGSSPLHRLGAGPKLAGLMLSVIATTVFVRDLPALAFALAAVVVAYALAGIGPRAAAAALWPVAPAFVLLAAVQTIFSGWFAALVLVGVLVVSVLAAALVSATTRVTDMLDAVVRGLRPLRRLGVPTERVALVLSLTVRAIPMLAVLLAQITETRRARGVRWTPRALVVPLVLGVFALADALGDALIARGADDAD